MNPLAVRKKLLGELKRYASEGVGEELRGRYHPVQAELPAEEEEEAGLEPDAPHEGCLMHGGDGDIDDATLAALLGE